jgi:hypothetical protein
MGAPESNTGIVVGSGVPGGPLNLAQLPVNGAADGQRRQPFCLSLLMPAFKTSAVPIPAQAPSANAAGTQQR